MPQTRPLSIHGRISVCFSLIGKEIIWEGKNENETGKDVKTGKILVRVNPVFFRPAEVDVLIGDYSKAKRELGWMPKIMYRELAEIMLKKDLERQSKS